MVSVYGIKTYVEALDRSKFGYITDDVTLIPPLTIPNPKNIFLYGDNGLRDAYIYNKPIIYGAHNNSKHLFPRYFQQRKKYIEQTRKVKQEFT